MCNYFKIVWNPSRTLTYFPDFSEYFGGMCSGAVLKVPLENATCKQSNRSSMGGGKWVYFLEELFILKIKVWIVVHRQLWPTYTWPRHVFQFDHFQINFETTIDSFPAESVFIQGDEFETISFHTRLPSIAILWQFHRISNNDFRWWFFQEFALRAIFRFFWALLGMLEKLVGVKGFTPPCWPSQTEISLHTHTHTYTPTHTHTHTYPHTRVNAAWVKDITLHLQDYSEILWNRKQSGGIR